MQIDTIAQKIITKFKINASDYVRKPRAGHPGWTNKQFIELILTYDTGAELVAAENCGTQTFNRAVVRLLHPCAGKLQGGNETYKNVLMFHAGLKKCPSCNLILEYISYAKDISKSYGISTYCKECVSERNKKYYENYKNIYHKVYIEDHRTEYNARNAHRRAKKISATPKWANLDIIKRVYEHCPEGCHVDHKVPLSGDNVCGLHVENNLQYLTVQENLEKNNKLLEEFKNSNLT